jgi:hypothetical protein
MAKIYDKLNEGNTDEAIGTTRRRGYYVQKAKNTQSSFLEKINGKM